MLVPGCFPLAGQECLCMMQDLENAEWRRRGRSGQSKELAPCRKRTTSLLSLHARLSRHRAMVQRMMPATATVLVKDGCICLDRPDWQSQKGTLAEVSAQLWAGSARAARGWARSGFAK
jgi:hypothetical protein